MLSSDPGTTRVDFAAVAARGRGAADGPVPRVLIYSHDTAGLGNIRRTLRIVDAISEEFPGASILVVTGSPMIHAFPLRRGVDYVKLPAVERVDSEVYRSRFLPARCRELTGARADILRVVVASFEPDLMLVDKRPGGVGGELLSAIQLVRRSGSNARIVLGMRDILDAPAVTREIFARTRTFEAIERFYDEVWIYGCREVFDPLSAYGFPESVARRTHFSGYLVPAGVPRPAASERTRVLVTPGGGEDGAALVESWLRSAHADAPADLESTVVLGPLMDAAQQGALRERAGACPGLRLLDFHGGMHELLAEADVAVTMAGYNTVCELLGSDRPAVLVPRGEPVAEQLLRARRLAELGLFKMVEPGEVGRADLPRQARRALARRAEAARLLDLQGLAWIRNRVRELLGVRSAA